MLSETLKKILRITWIAFLLAGGIVYVCYHRSISEKSVISFIQGYRSGMMVIFFLICVLRGFTLIPSTPFLVAGAVLFGSTPFLLILLFITSILIASSFIFYASGRMDLANHFSSRHPGKCEKIRTKLQGRFGFYFILFWAFAPVTPTDLICYVAGSLRLRFVPFIIPLILGETIISTLYVLIINQGLTL